MSAFDKKPSTWLGAGYSIASSEVKLTTNDNGGTKLLTELTDAEAHATTGDIRKVLFAILEMIYTKSAAQGSGAAANRMTINRSISEPTAGTVRKSYTLNFDTVTTAQEVNDEPAPTVTAISPATGATAGGTAVTITGTGFSANATVTIGGHACTSVVVVSSTSITAVTPADDAGAKDIVVTNADSQTGTLSAGFTYA